MPSNKSHKIGTWRQFAKHVRSNGCSLLKDLDKYPNTILVSGCQRSGTTMIARLIFQSEGMINYWVGQDDELDAALILSGYMNHVPQHGRYCFQTTYLNECYQEYIKHKGEFRLIWVLRNPYSVINSMLYNWSRFALNELFDACGASLLTGKDRMRYEKYGRIAINRAHRACMAYQGKTLQLFELHKNLGADVLVVDYDELVSSDTILLHAIYEFIDLPFKENYTDSINRNSISKAKKLPNKIRDMISETSMPVYEQARSLLSPPFNQK